MLTQEPIVVAGMIRFFIRTCFWALVLSPAVIAQQQGSTDPNSVKSVQETIVVTGSYEPAPLEETDRSVAVITDQPPTLFRTWADALRLDPAIDIRQRAPGTQADISILGSSFEQTLVLVDGIRINDAQSSHHDLDLPIPFESVERIEVLHGAGSTLYGSDAVGGAVNFITGTPQATEIRLGAGGGSFGTNTENGEASLVTGKWSEQLSFTRDFSSGFMPGRDYRNFASASETRFDTALGHSTILLGLSDRPFGANQFYGDFNSWERTKGWFLAGSQQLGESTDVAFGYRRHSDEFILVRGEPQIYENNHITESWQGALHERTKLTENTSLYYGAEIYRDSINSNNLGHHSRNRGAFFFGSSGRALGRFSLSIGAREEVFSRGTADFSPGISGGYWMSSHLRMRASAAHAFRLPTYTDLYYSDPANVGNPNLRPENAWDYEGGLEWTARDNLSASITVFHRREHDIIDYVRGSDSSRWQAANIDNLRFTGAEILTSFKVNRKQKINIGYTALYGAQHSLAGLQSRYISDYPVNQATVSWFGSFRKLIQVRTRVGVTERYRADPYPLVEASATKKFGAVEPYVQTTNAINTGYYEISGVRMPGRAIIGGMQITFSRHRERCSDCK